MTMQSDTTRDAIRNADLALTENRASDVAMLLADLADLADATPEDILDAVDLLVVSGASPVAQSLVARALDRWPAETSLREELGYLNESSEPLANDDSSPASAPPGGLAAGDAETDHTSDAAETDHGSGASPDHAHKRPPAGDGEPADTPDDAALSRLLHRFDGRPGVHARQWASATDHGYSPVHHPLTLDRLRRHVAGTETLGVYLLQHADTVRFLVLDIDLRKSSLERLTHEPRRWPTLRDALASATTRVQAALSDLRVPHLLADSGRKGRHAYVFFDAPVAARHARSLGSLVLERVGAVGPHIEIEVFPRQDRARAGGLGNLVKLPLGVHRVSGRRCHLLGSNGAPLADPWRALADVGALTGRDVAQLLGTLADETPASTQRPNAAARSTSSVATPSQGHDIEAAPGLAAPLPRQAAAALPGLESSSASPAAWRERDDNVGDMIRGCPVLSGIVDDLAGRGGCTHDDRVILRHTIGRSDAGIALLQNVYESMPGVPAHDRTAGRCCGHPISCAGVRRRVPARAARVPCHCVLHRAPQEYPSPVLHVRRRDDSATAPPVEADAPPCAEQPARAGADPRAALAAALRASPDGRVSTLGGSWSLRRRGRREVLLFEPDRADDR